jgi:hypothetical protein
VHALGFNPSTGDYTTRQPDFRGTRALDERALLAVDLQQKLTEWIGNAGEQLDRYLVNDPYGQESLSASVAHFFGHAAPSWVSTAGAGVGSLLYSLAGLSRAAVACIMHRIVTLSSIRGRWTRTAGPLYSLNAPRS